jgi:type IV secretory pathway VirB10-like protein
MTDTPKFTVIDRRKMKAEEEKGNPQPPATPVEAAPAATEPAAGPRLVVNEHKPEAAEAQTEAEQQEHPELPPPPTAQESKEQKTAYDASAQRLEDIVRAQNPAMGPQPPVTFEHLVQQFYVSAMIQMGAGAQEGQRPRIDILGARQTIDLLGLLVEKTRGNLTDAEDRMLQTVLYEVRMAFLELTSMISLQGMQPPPPPPPGKS